MKILHTLSQRPEATGSGIYVKSMIKEAEAAGHKNFLLAGTVSSEKPEINFIHEKMCSFIEFEGEDLKFPVAGMSDVMPYRSSRFCDLTEDELSEYNNCFSEKLKKAVNDFQPDIIHSNHLWLLTSLICRLFPHIPVLSTCHGSDLRQFKNCIHLRKRVTEGCRRLRSVIALSRAQKAEIAELYGIPENNIHIVGAGYDKDIFFHDTKPEPHSVQIAYAGKLSKAKGLPWMLRALLKIKDLPWELHIAGSASCEKEMNEVLHPARGYRERVTLHGLVPQRELADILRKSHIFVLPSFYEGLPLVLLEALACGCRLIATRLPGIIEVFGSVKSDHIDLVDTPRLKNVDTPYPEDEDNFVSLLSGALKTQILSAREKPEINLLQIKNITEGYSWQKVFERVEKIYRQAAGQ